MGNSPSSPPKHSHSAGQSLSQVHSQSHSSQRRESDKSQYESQPRNQFKRRESAHVLPTTIPKATPAPPSASLTSAVAQPTSTSASTSSSPSQPRSISKSSAHSRNRSGTGGTTGHAQDISNAIMGNDNSKQQREPSRSRSLRSSERSPAAKTSASPATQPMDMPAVQETQPPSLDSSNRMIEPHVQPPNSFSRPPRLPMAIEEEDITPGSPIMSPTGDQEMDPLEQEQLQEEGRRGSVISSNVDDEEEPDEFQGYMPGSNANTVKVPTIIEYRNASPHDRIYVTGTFTDWQRKFRLHWNGPSKKPHTVSAVIQLPPGTHHVKFLVNNEMVCSDYLPQAVDFTNILVNYVEVNAENAPHAPKTAPVAVPAPTNPAASAQVAAPATAQSSAQAPARPMDIRPKQSGVPSASSPAPPTSPANKAHTPVSASPAPARASPRPVPTSAVQQDAKPVPSPTTAKPKIPVPAKQYTSQIPEYLIDLDSWPAGEQSQSPESSTVTSRYQRANQAAQTLPAPPTLPLFLNKSILNGATPMKDDSSVLVFPNHTVLNHLATTNIKQGVLATSATTRYKKKFLTTIMYKPRSEDGD